MRHPLRAGARGAWQQVVRRCVCAVALAHLATTMFVLADAQAASNVFQYTRDAAGNIVAIQRANPAPISISAFAPTSGPPGTTVSITGTGFAASPAGNAVTFNGAAATVTAASATTLAVTVPSGASTGKIAVSVAGNAATSAQDFTVTTAGAPTIAAFTPAAGAAGTPVTVVGANFNPATGATTVKLNQTAATVSTIAPAQLTFPVPLATGSGRLRVATAAGTAVSAADFVVPPPTVAAADIVASTRLVANGPAQALSVLALNKFGLILFDGSPGDWVSLQLANFLINPVGATLSYAIYKPDNTQLASGTVSATSLTIHAPQLPAAGTYVVLLKSGTTQVSLDARLETNRTLAGTTLAVTAGAGQSTRVLWTGVAGDQKALSIAALASDPAGVSLSYQITNPNGTLFRAGIASGSGDTLLLSPFATTGTYAALLWPTSFVQRASYQLTLLPGVSLAIDGAAQTVTNTVPGAGARLNFAGIAGDNLGLGVTGPASDPTPSINATVSVFKPDGSQLVSMGCYAGGTQCAANLAKLPVAGNYSVIVQPAGVATGTLRIWLSRDVAGALASGTPMALALGRPGQNARLTFSGVAGALAAIQVRGVATTPAGQGLLVQLLRPDGVMQSYMHLTGIGQTLVAPLPAAGAYALVVEPEPAAQGAATAAMDVLLDPGQALAIDGPTLSSTIAIAGGSARYTFAGTVGQNLGLGISNLALNPMSDATVAVYAPDGTTMTSITCGAAVGRCGANLVKLTSTGTYGIVVRPAGATGTLAATLSTDFADSLTLGSALPVNLDRPGRNARVTFAGTAGQALRISWSGVAISGAVGYAYVYVYAPDGSMLAAASFANGAAGGFNLPLLAATGTYTIFIDPPLGAPMSVNLALSTR
jgi:hypothetical protein